MNSGNSVPNSSALGRVGRPLKALLLNWLIPLAVALVIIQFVLYRETSVPGLAPRPSSELRELSSESDLQARFAQDAGHTRLLLLISPT